ncbi:methyl-accepting chemotaxis protein [Cellvibrio sp. PSBB023]|uniref:methyl-accepting chemotaxis protein n=1 Tax=Cellvibrio sp. PSBB023 TaxID=1945512 RepID=UPI00098FB088|nr:methyl-accepting chemotaxis protein [Cellvibrio sp. PSBB023]AQT59907.1 methyl-accepting chemotaxis protein [Cellvibrio sp. PSBB023]
MFGWYQKLNLRWKIRLPLLLLVIVVVYMGYYSMATSQMLGANAITIAKVNLPEIELLIQADRDLYQALVAERALLQLDNASTSKLVTEQSDNAQQAYDRIYKSLELSNTATSVERDEFTRRYKQWRQLADEVMRDAVNPERREAAQEKSYGAAADAFEHVRTYIDELQEKRLAHVDQFTTQIDESQDSATRYLLISAVIGSLVSLGAAFFLPVIVANQISQISDRIQNIAEGDGDLTIRIPVDTQDELGQLASHVNRFMEKLQRIIASVLTNASEVSKTAESLLEVSSNSQRAADDQCHAITMVVTAVNELTMAIQEVARNTGNTAQNTREATAITDNGQERIRLAVDRVQQLAVRIKETADFMLQLESEAKNVTSVIDVIRGVAEQTNLLALNAAIEAARAGEQGRGFAVVADEVRTLASRTQQSTADIQGMLSQLQQGVQRAVEAMGSSSAMTSEAASSANEAGQSLMGISTAVKEIADMTIQIATAAEEQSSVTSEIDKNLVQINSLAMNNADGASKTATESQRLNELSIQLRQLLAQFKV